MVKVSVGVVGRQYETQRGRKVTVVIRDSKGRDITLTEADLAKSYRPSGAGR